MKIIKLYILIFLAIGLPGVMECAVFGLSVPMENNYPIQKMPAQIDSIIISEANLPVLIGQHDNVVTRIKIYAGKSERLKKIDLSLKGTADLSDIENLIIYSTGKTEKYTKGSNKFAASKRIKRKFTLSGDLTIEEGVNYLWVTVSLKKNAGLRNRISVTCLRFQFTQDKIKPLPFTPFTGNRNAIALRSQNDDQVNTYRIPGLATTNKGTLVAVYDMRHKNAVDLQADIDVGMSRSADGGKTWEPMKLIMDMGTSGSLPQDQNGIGDPAVLVDKQTGTIWVAAIWVHGHPGKRNWTNSQQGMTPEKTSQLMLVKSDDDGITWSPPINITAQIKNHNWFLLLQGPGKGITMRDGTLVFPAQYKDSAQMPHATIIYSKDHGLTWKIGTSAKINTTEAQVVELDNGSLMLNMRDNRGGSRSIFTTNDMGDTWLEHGTSGGALIEPVCMASLDRFYYKNEEGEIKKILLFSNPNSTKGRFNMTIKISFDEGSTWPAEYFTLIDSGNGRGYSCITQIDEFSIGILYESSVADLVFQIIDIREILVTKNLNQN